jgi:hypothetical protein
MKVSTLAVPETTDTDLYMPIPQTKIFVFPPLTKSVRQDKSTTDEAYSTHQTHCHFPETVKARDLTTAAVLEEAAKIRRHRRQDATKSDLEVMEVASVAEWTYCWA